MSASPRSLDARPDRDEAPPLDVEGLDAGFGTHLVLRGICLRLERGEVTVVLGPNGAGKTTLVRAICGRLRPRAGQVRICGMAAEDGAARALIGLAPQEIALYGALTIWENLEVFARLAGVPAGQVFHRVEEVMARSGLAERSRERIDRLSGGWRRRANVAAALVGAPRLLVLDEPTVGIDAAAREDLENLVRRLAADGLAILLVTHDFSFAERVADRVAFLLEGRIVREGPLKALIEAQFSGRRAVEIQFPHAPSETLRAQIAALGLARGAEPDRFHGLVADEARAVSDLIVALQGLGAEPRTIALKPAGLDTLYAHVTDHVTEGEHA